MSDDKNKNAANPATEAQLIAAAEKLVVAAKKAGASDADAVVGRSRSFGVSVRNGVVEGTTNSENNGLSLRVFVGQRVANVSASVDGDLDRLAERAVAMAKASPEDASQGLAAPDDLATTFPDLDLYDASEPDAETLTDMAIRAEAAGLKVKGIANSVGASAGIGSGGLVLVTSDGFSGAYNRSGFSVSASLLAGQGTKMERDYDYSSRIHFADLEAPEIIGARAAERAVKRLNPTKPKTGKANIVFDPRVSRSIAGHLAGAINGASIVRGSSFLKKKMGEQIFPSSIQVHDNPLLPRRPASRPFDGEGVGAAPLVIIENGVLKTWLLSSSTAKDLGLKTNGRGSRSGTSVSPSSTNFGFAKGDMTPEQLIKQVGNGIYVTEVFGQGVNMVTGEYSRGASGYLIENGEITSPVSEFTIASDLNHIFANLILADDIDPNYGTLAPTLAVPGFTVAGQ